MVENSNMRNPAVRLVPLGGIGDVTKNMYVYEYLPDGENVSDIIVVDCGIGFPKMEMYGIDLIIPDVSYLMPKKDKIRGFLLTHGHEDHIGALPYILPQLNSEVYATSLTAALSEGKLEEFNISRKINRIGDDSYLSFGPFRIEPVAVTHSIPAAVNFIIKTPVGNFYHGSDFKFDWTPVDGRLTQVDKIVQAGKIGVLCLLSDCVRVEKEGYTLSEKVIEQTFEDEIRHCRGKFIVTTQSSNISRWQQAINVAVSFKRKIAILGRSCLKSIEIAKKSGYLKIPDNSLISERELIKYPPQATALLVAGSQGQIDSALSRIAAGENKYVKIKEGDKVIFSSDPIPGNENAVYTLIDELTRLGAKIVYTDILEDLHVSGHGSAHDLRLMIALSCPKYLLPIGGTFRHMRQYAALGSEMGYSDKNIMLLENGQTVIFKNNQAYLAGKVDIKNILVDGLGIGDVGHVVLRDRQKLATDGIVVVIVTIASDSGRLTSSPDIISRGFVYAKDAKGLLHQAREEVKKVLRKKRTVPYEPSYLRKIIASSLEEFFFKMTHRRPLILPVVVEA